MSCSLPPGCSRISANKSSTTRSVVPLRTNNLQRFALRPPYRHVLRASTRLLAQLGKHFVASMIPPAMVFGYALFHTQQPTYRGEIDGSEANIVFGG
jgi:hypothetical protein